MRILQDIRYRCAICGEPMMRDGGNRHHVDQTESTWMCLGQTPQMCPHFGVRVRIPLVYLDVQPL